MIQHKQRLTLKFGIYFKLTALLLNDAYLDSLGNNILLRNKRKKQITYHFKIKKNKTQEVRCTFKEDWLNHFSNKKMNRKYPLIKNKSKSRINAGCLVD